MGYDIVPGEFCGSYYGHYEIKGSRGAVYHVTLGGGEGPAHCTCPSFKFFKGSTYDRTCKHIERVHAEACMWNCQWHEGNNPVKLRPVEVYSPNKIHDAKCKNCGGPLVAVRIAI